MSFTTFQNTRIIRTTPKGALLGNGTNQCWLPRRAVSELDGDRVSVGTWAIEMKQRDGVDLHALFSSHNGDAASAAIQTAVKDKPELAQVVERLHHIERTIDKLGSAVLDLVNTLRDQRGSEPVKPDIEGLEILTTHKDEQPDTEPAGNLLDDMVADLETNGVEQAIERRSISEEYNREMSIARKEAKPENPMVAMLQAMKAQQDKKRGNR